MMSHSEAWIKEVRLVTTDPEVTEVYVLVEARGDSPGGIQGWHHKTFPARIPAVEILSEHFADHILWPLDAPTL